MNHKMYDNDEMLYMSGNLANMAGDTVQPPCKKIRKRSENVVRHEAKMKAKRRKRNKMK